MCVDEGILECSERITSIWDCGRKRCRIQTTDTNVIRRMRSWKFLDYEGHSFKDSTYIFSIPRSKKKFCCRALGIAQPESNPNRAAVGRGTGSGNLKSGAVSPG